jgi:hypothetical protein
MVSPVMVASSRLGANAYPFTTKPRRVQTISKHKKPRKKTEKEKREQTKLRSNTPHPGGRVFFS